MVASSKFPSSRSRRDPSREQGCFLFRQWTIEESWHHWNSKRPAYRSTPFLFPLGPQYYPVWCRNHPRHPRLCLVLCQHLFLQSSLCLPPLLHLCLPPLWFLRVLYTLLIHQRCLFLIGFWSGRIVANSTSKMSFLRQPGTLEWTLTSRRRMKSRSWGRSSRGRRECCGTILLQQTILGS